MRVADPHRYTRWRVATLILVHVLIAAHITHWLVAGTTMAPLELNEVMYTMELGIVTAGFLLMASVALGTLIFGRFFCSWGCHILALQDLSAWLLRRLGIRPKAVRSRLLLWLPWLAAGYMFIWPHLVRVWNAQSMPQFHSRTDAQGWASFSTENFWRNLPGPWVILLTFGILGPLMIYTLGSRSFCSYGCPYGAFFGLLDKFAPGKIRVKPGRSCGECGACTAACSSHVRVHEELARYGMVVNSRCLKDMDCVAACPEQSLHLGFGLPTVFSRAQSDTLVRRRYDFTWLEELGVAAAALVTILVYRGLYDRVPFLMTLGFSAVAGAVTMMALRMLRQPEVRFQRFHLKSKGALRPSGRVLAALCTVFALITIHSGFVRYHTWAGRRAGAAVQEATAVSTPLAASAIAHLECANAWGLMPTPQNHRIVGELQGRLGHWTEAEKSFQRVLEWNPTDPLAARGLVRALAAQDRSAEAASWLRGRPEPNGNDAPLFYDLAGSMHARGDVPGAVQALRDAVQRRPDFARAHRDLGAGLLELGDAHGAVDHLQRAVSLEPASAEGHYNLSLALWISGLRDDARREIDVAASLNPADTQTLQLRAMMQP